MTDLPTFRPPETVFMGATPATGGHIDRADAVLFGAPHGTPYPGIDNRGYEDAANALRRSFGPDASWTDHWNFDFDGTLLNDGAYGLVDLGDLETEPLTGEANRQKIEQATRAVLGAGAMPIMIGGDDSVPIPFFAGFADHGPITIVQVDAHIDWREERRGEPLGFSSTMRRASEMSHVTGIVQVGMRGFGSARRQEVDTARDWGAKIVPASAVHHTGINAALQHVQPGARCVLTIDCDGLDAAIMPAVMAPTPGGLTYLQVLDLIAGLTAKADLVGVDMIEFVPKLDPQGTSAITAAGILSNVIGRSAAK